MFDLGQVKFGQARVGQARVGECRFEDWKCFVNKMWHDALNGGAAACPLVMT